MVTQQNEDIRLCQNCEEISIWNFNKLLKGSGYEHLVYGYDGHGEYDLSSYDCDSLYNDIKEEAFKLAKNDDALNILLLEADINALETRFKTVFILLSVLISGNYSEGYLDKYIDELKEWRYYVNKGKDLLEELERLSKQHLSSKTVINKKKNELKQIIDNQGENISLIRQKIKLQRVLTMQMDLKNISVVEWFEMIREAAEVIKSSTNEESNKRY